MSKSSKVQKSAMKSAKAPAAKKIEKPVIEEPAAVSEEDVEMDSEDEEEEDDDDDTLSPKAPTAEEAEEVEEKAEEAKKAVIEAKCKDPYLLKDAAYIKQDKNWKNKQRTLLFSSRGITGQHRHLMEDLKKILPHHKVEAKFEKHQDFGQLNEVAELKSCKKII